MASRKNTPLFTYTNPHPKGIMTIGDCVFRAISIATGKTWLEVYDELTVLGRELLAPPNDKRTFAVYLDRIADRIQVRSVAKRPTGKTVARLDPTKTYVMNMASHLATVQGGKIRDTWDCGDKAAYTVWQLKD